MTDPYPAEPLWGYDASPDSDPWGPPPPSGGGGRDASGYNASRSGTPTTVDSGAHGTNGSNGAGGTSGTRGRSADAHGERDAPSRRGTGRGATTRGADGADSSAGDDRSAGYDRSDGHDSSAGYDGVEPRSEPARAAERAPAGPSRQVFIPAPEDLPPFDEVVEPIYPRRQAVVPDPGPGPDDFGAAGVPPAPELAPGDAPPPAPDLSRPAGGRPLGSGETRPGRKPIDRRRIAVVYDVDGPRVRLGLAWFVGAMVAVVVGPFAIAVVLAVAAGFAARQVVRAWASVSWQADVAAGLGAVPVLAALLGTKAVIAAVVLALLVAVGASFAPDGPRLPGRGGRRAAVIILAMSVVPALGAATVVLVRAESVLAAAVLILVASAYELGDYIVGSGASNPVEGPLAGVTTAALVSLPLALVLVEPYNVAGVALLGFTAVVLPLGQLVGSAVLPGAGAHAPALRRIDTLFVLAPLWAAAAGAL